MKFNYYKIPLRNPTPTKKYILRPMIPINIKHGAKSCDNLMALVDSGADYCLFPEDVGVYLGINIKSGIKQVSLGIEAGVIPTYFHRVIITIGEYNINVMAGFPVFKDRKKRLPFSILGHNPIFEKFEIIFNRHNETIELKPIKT